MLTETLRYLGIAFASSAILIVLSKIILQHLIRRPADYYLAEELRQEELMLNLAGLSINDEIETNPEGENTAEHVHVKPQFTLEDELEMHLFENDHIPDHIVQAEHEAVAAHEQTGAAASAKPEMPETNVTQVAKTEEPETEVTVAAKPEKTETDAAAAITPMKQETEIVTISPEKPETVFRGDIDLSKEAITVPDRSVQDGGEGTGRKGKTGKTGRSGKKDSTSRSGKKDSSGKSDKRQDGKKDERLRNPSMKMRRDELIAMAEAEDIDVPERAIKKDIIDLIIAARGIDNTPTQASGSSQKDKPKTAKNSTGSRRRTNKTNKSNNSIKKKKESKNTDEI